jgi:hypothetical protein
VMCTNTRSVFGKEHTQTGMVSSYLDGKASRRSVSVLERAIGPVTQAIRDRGRIFQPSGVSMFPVHKEKRQFTKIITGNVFMF